MLRKSLAITLAALTTLGGSSTLFTITTLLVSNPLLTMPASARPIDPIDRPDSPTRPNPLPRPAPTSQNYPAAVQFLLKNSSLMQQVVTTAWNDGGKGIAQQKMNETLNGKSLRKGVSIYNSNVRLGNISQQQVVAGPGSNQVSVVILITGNDAEFKTTTPSIFGSYADPSFRVGFNLTVNLKVSTLTNQIQVDDISANISNANIRGSNLTGTLVETFADFFTKGGFSRDVVSNINRGYSVKNDLASSIKSAIGRLVPGQILKV